MKKLITLITIALVAITSITAEEEYDYRDFTLDEVTLQYNQELVEDNLLHMAEDFQSRVGVPVGYKITSSVHTWKVGSTIDIKQIRVANGTFLPFMNLGNSEHGSGTWERYSESDYSLMDFVLLVANTTFSKNYKYILVAELEVQVVEEEGVFSRESLIKNGYTIVDEVVGE